MPPVAAETEMHDPAVPASETFRHVRSVVHSCVAGQSVFDSQATQRAFTQRPSPGVLQSLASTHSTQLPLPLHTPPVHAWCAALGVVPHRAVLLTQLAARHALLGTGQSAGATH